MGSAGSLRGPGRRAPVLKTDSRAVARRRDQQRTGRRGEVYEYCVLRAVGGVGIVAVDGASATRVAELANRRAALSVPPAAALSLLALIVVSLTFAASPLLKGITECGSLLAGRRRSDMSEAETANSIGGGVLSRSLKTKRPPRMAGACHTVAAMDCTPQPTRYAAQHPCLPSPDRGHLLAEFALPAR